MMPDGNLNVHKGIRSIYNVNCVDKCMIFILIVILRDYGIYKQK